MAYSLYRLEFDAGLHIGADTGGPSLDNSRMTIHSDTLFSALCCECAGSGDITRLYEYFSDNALTISDALPYYRGEFFLPKPILYKENVRRESSSAQKKAFKSIEYIPLSMFNEYVRSLSGAEIDPERLRYDFGTMVVDTRVSVEESLNPMPYNIAYWRFNRDSGLYVVVDYNDERALSFFEDALSSLGLSGIGGKQSAGLGKFGVQKCPLPPSLEALLDDRDADYQMLLGTALPSDGELDKALAGGWYTVIRRGGFVRSNTYSSRQLKKRTIYMLSSGSCLKARFDGEIFDLSDGGAHPVWRCGKTMFAGVKL